MRGHNKFSDNTLGFPGSIPQVKLSQGYHELQDGLDLVYFKKFNASQPSKYPDSKTLSSKGVY